VPESSNPALNPFAKPFSLVYGAFYLKSTETSLVTLLAVPVIIWESLVPQRSKGLVDPAYSQSTIIEEPILLFQL
jgi:hypothetical protein